MKDRIRSKIRITSLKEQLILLFLMVSIIPLLLVSFMAYNNGKNALEGSIGQSLSQLAIEKVEKADRSILRAIEEIKSRTATLREKVKTANKTASEILEGRWIYEGEAITGIQNDVELLEAIAGDGGQVVIAVARPSDDNPGKDEGHVIGATDKSLAFDQSNESWWKKAYSIGKGYDFVDNVKYDPKRELHYIPISVPIRETDAQDSDAIGVLRIVFALPELKEIVDPESNNKIGEGTEVLIITDEELKVVAAPPDSDYEIFKSKVESLVGMQALSPEIYDYYGYGTESEGAEVIGRAHTEKWNDPKYKDRNFANWTVLVSQPTDIAFAVAKELRNNILVFTLLSCLIIVPIAWIFARKTVKPILTLANAAKEIGKGEFDREIPITSSNEVGILAEEFGLMQKNLKRAIKELTREEKKMTAVVNSLSEGLIVVDKSDHILHINRFAMELLDIENISEKMTTSNLIQSQELTQAFEKSAAQIREDSKIGSSEVVLERGESEIVLKVLASPFVDENGQALGSVYVLYDMTREREIDRMKTDFVRLVSHELRTPLTSIIGFVQLILDGKAGEINDVQKQSLARVAKQSKRLSSLINNLLDISRIESGVIEMKHEPVSLLEIVKQRAEEIRPQADGKDINLSLTAPDSLPAFIGDEERIGQVVTNLIGNAIKFTPNGGKVRVRIRLQGGSLLHLEVIDTGPGVPEEERQKIFDKFYQLSDVSTRQQGGSGLGLSIANSIVESHGGRIWVDDGGGGKGSNFQFVLPVVSRKAKRLLNS